MEQDKKEFPTIYFRIEEIRKISHFENNFLDLGFKKTDLKKFNFEILLGLGIDGDEGNISQIIKTRFFIKVGVDEKDLFGLESLHKYKIKDFKSLFGSKSCDKYQIPDNLMTTFLGISISGTRSMLAVLNTVPEYSKIFLPPINPLKLLETIKTKLNS